VIINRAGEVLYLHGRTDDYLAQPSGLPTRDLIAQARIGLRSKLRRAVQEATTERRRVLVAGVPVHRGNASLRVRIAVEPLDASNEVQDLWLVSFEDEPAAKSPPAAADGDGAAGDGDEVLVRQLEASSARRRRTSSTRSRTSAPPTKS
jgi:two-component system CheB/CheR fusion protein